MVADTLLTRPPPSTSFTDQEKLAELTRELELRHRVYRWQVRNGKMSKEQAKRQIDILIAIKLDYAAKVQAQPPGPLFQTGGG